MQSEVGDDYLIPPWRVLFSDKFRPVRSAGRLTDKLGLIAQVVRARA
jgi:hypothetical protein